MLGPHALQARGAAEPCDVALGAPQELPRGAAADTARRDYLFLVHVVAERSEGDLVGILVVLLLRPASHEPGGSREASLLLLGIAAEKQGSEVDRGAQMPLVDCEAVPARRLASVLWHSLAAVTEKRERVLGIQVTLLGGEAIPASRLASVLRHALPLTVALREGSMRRCVALLGGEAEQASRLASILRNS